jgi:acyl-CoA thioester hydrolase
MTATHRTTVRVYYEDTDFSGNVYHAAYLKFCERGRTELLRDLGIHHSELLKDGIAFAVRAMTIDFARPAHIDDLLDVVTVVDTVSGVRLTLKQSVLRAAEVLVTARVEVVAIRADGRPTRLPPALRDRAFPVSMESKQAL